MSGSELRRRAHELYTAYRPQRGGKLDDYLAVAVLEQHFQLPLEQAMRQAAIEGSSTGLNGYHVDFQRRNLYLLSCSLSKQPDGVKSSLKQLVSLGLAMLYGPSGENAHQDPFARTVRGYVIENRAVIDQVIFRFLSEAPLSQLRSSQMVLKLREDLEDRKFLLDEFFGRPVAMMVQFQSLSGDQEVMDLLMARTYQLSTDSHLQAPGPQGESMHVLLVPLRQLADILLQMGPRFLDRNIRHGLGPAKTTNRAIAGALKNIVLDGSESPLAFAFHHNGVTLSSVRVEFGDGWCRVTEPRVLNGAQTLTTFRDFLEKHRQQLQAEPYRTRLDAIQVLCKLITNASSEFVTAVTINNNRQNPVAAWHLRAHDPVQLELQDRFLFELGIFYERQEGAFRSLSESEKQQMGLRELNRPIEMTRLARTILVAEGELQLAHNLQEVFERDQVYERVFNPSRMAGDLRRFVLCYKIRDRLGKLAGTIEDRGPNKYWFVTRARQLIWSLLCQAILNHPDLDQLASDYGQDLVLREAFVDELSRLASARCRPLLGWLTEDSPFAQRFQEGDLRIFGQKEAWKACMEEAGRRWGWERKSLR